MNAKWMLAAWLAATSVALCGGLCGSAWAVDPLAETAPAATEEAAASEAQREEDRKKEEEAKKQEAVVPNPFAPLLDDSALTLLPTRTPRSLAESTSAITFVPRYFIQTKKAFDLTDVVRLAPSLSLAQNGTRNKTTSVFLRGTNSNHTLVLIDGVRANKPSDGRFDFDAFPIEDIDRIEVLRGPQSALYGADAMGGVINIVTRPGSGPLRTGSRLEFGNYGVNRQSLTANGQLGETGLSLTFTRLKTSGLFDNDDSRVLAGSLRLDRALSSSTNLTVIGRINDGEIGTPGQRDLAYDPNARSYPRDLFGTIQLTHNSGKRRDRLVLGAIDRKLRFDDPENPGAAFPSFTDSDLRDKIYTLDAQSSFDLGAHTLTLGGEWRRERSIIDSQSTFGDSQFTGTTTTRALFVQDEFRTGKLSIVPGLRFEDNSQFGSDLNGRLAMAYDFNARTKLKTSIGTAFRAPAMNELYFPNSGDPNLLPEESVGYEIGIERNTRRGGRFEVTLFRNDFKNLIGTVATPVTPQYPFGFKAGNTGEATTQGIEFALRQPIGSNMVLAFNHAFIDTKSSGDPLLRRPKFVTSADLLYQKGRLSYDLGLIAHGRRFDNDFAAPPFGNGRGLGIYDGYTRLDFSIGYSIAPNAQLYVRAQNLLNNRYEEVAGFPAPGRNIVFGFQSRAF